MRSYIVRSVGQRPTSDADQTPIGREAAPGSEFVPPTDVSETDEGYEVRMEIAGIDPDTAAIVVGEDNRMLSVSGVRPAAAGRQGRRLLNLEVQYGGFGRRLLLPEPVDLDLTTASYDEGFLIIRLPKLRPTGRRRRIPIEREIDG